MKNLLSILFVILVCDHITYGYRILGVFPITSKSHWIMQESLMVGLARRGHQVDVVTHFPLKKSEPNYKEISLEGSIGLTVNNLTANESHQFNNLNMKRLTDLAGTRICNLLDHPKLRDLLENPPQDPPYDLVITEVRSIFFNANMFNSYMQEVQKWLDESKDGCVYFTFGSMVRIETFPKEIIEQFYASFEKIAPVRVLMKVVKKEDLLPGLPKNVMTQSWFPQKTVLKHKNIRAFITHGGSMGTQEAIYFGIPMIGIPLFGDQRVNILNYVSKKVAISLENIQNVTEAELTLALNTILKDPTYRSNVQKLSKMFLDRPVSPLNTSIFWVEYIAKYGSVASFNAIHLQKWNYKATSTFTRKRGGPLPLWALD
ncbi:UDP-glucuronosyltransferase 2B17-like [Pseudomyrmex gracilis]|uniref:UDP-glucuronosyltransferase 2B17-like n=1 Tax=Pseudomyrmex gracilis TaxID=219809 RepID=UPI00099528A6|nr:UDP-glucuronosyltransferase 2B17-like [Pseudomyrmex gracilis]